LLNYCLCRPKKMFASDSEANPADVTIEERRTQQIL
jgi:hypothetical protein